MDDETKKMIDEAEELIRGLEESVLWYKERKKTLGKRAIDPNVERILKVYRRDIKRLREWMEIVKLAEELRQRDASGKGGA
jgi:uncharacterized membrane protein